MSDFKEATRLMAGAGGDRRQQERAMALFSTHTNLTAVLGLIQDAVDKDDLDGIEQKLDMLELLVQRHRHGHAPGRAATRRAFDGKVEVGPLNYVDGVVRIETDRFNLWLYEGKQNRQVRVEIEAK